MKAAYESAQKIYAVESAGNPDFKKIFDSQRAFQQVSDVWMGLAESTLASIPAREKISKEIADDPANIQATAEATKTAEQLMAEKVAEVVGADFKFRKL